MLFLNAFIGYFDKLSINADSNAIFIIIGHHEPLINNVDTVDVCSTVSISIIRNSDKYEFAQLDFVLIAI